MKHSLKHFEQLALMAISENGLPNNTYFYVEFKKWYKHPSFLNEEILIECTVCFYTKDGNFSSDGKTPQEAIERAVIAYKYAKLQLADATA